MSGSSAFRVNVQNIFHRQLSQRQKQIRWLFVTGKFLHPDILFVSKGGAYPRVAPFDTLPEV
jgi:hypothetical protein